MTKIQIITPALVVQSDAIFNASLSAAEKITHAAAIKREHEKAINQAYAKAVEDALRLDDAPATAPTTAELAIQLHAAVNAVMAGLDTVPERICTEALWLVLQMQAGPEHAAMMVSRFQVREPVIAHENG